jgi:hypothetical protein
VQRLAQQERLQQQGLLFCRKRREQQQPRESPTGAIFSCQFSLKEGEIKQFSKIAMVFTMTEPMTSRPSNSAFDYRVIPDLAHPTRQARVILGAFGYSRAATRRRTNH